MINKYCVDLDIGFDEEISIGIDNIISSHKKKIKSNYTKQIFRITRNDFPDILLNFLKPHDLTIIHGEIFYLPPGVEHTIHTDGEIVDDHCKLNWAVGGGESLMEWYKPLNEKAYVYLITAIGTKYLSFDSEYCEKVFESKVGSPSLVNAGQPHTVKNTSNSERWAITYVIGDIVNRKKVQWDIVYPLLKKYRKEK